MKKGTIVKVWGKCSKILCQRFSHFLVPFIFLKIMLDFPGGTVVKNPPANAGDMGSTLVQEDPTCHGATKSVRHNY